MLGFVRASMASWDDWTGKWASGLEQPIHSLAPRPWFVEQLPGCCPPFGDTGDPLRRTRRWVVFGVAVAWMGLVDVGLTEGEKMKLPLSE
jgi:hypothetical protein